MKATAFSPGEEISGTTRSIALVWVWGKYLFYQEDIATPGTKYKREHRVRPGSPRFTARRKSRFYDRRKLAPDPRIRRWTPVVVFKDDGSKPTRGIFVRRKRIYNFAGHFGAVYSGGGVQIASRPCKFRDLKPGLKARNEITPYCAERRMRDLRESFMPFLTSKELIEVRFCNNGLD